MSVVFGSKKTGRSLAVNQRRRGQPNLERCRKGGLLLTDREFDVDDEKTPVRPSRIWFTALACGLVFAMASLGVWFVYLSMSVSFQAETNLHYSRFALQLVERFVTEKGRWPRSWAELENLDMPNGPLGGEWPAFSGKLQQRISIDFGINPSDVARQDRMKFMILISTERRHATQSHPPQPITARPARNRKVQTASHSVRPSSETGIPARF